MRGKMRATVYRPVVDQSAHQQLAQRRAHHRFRRPGHLGQQVFARAAGERRSQQQEHPLLRGRQQPVGGHQHAHRTVNRARRHVRHALDKLVRRHHPQRHLVSSDDDGEGMAA